VSRRTTRFLPALLVLPALLLGACGDDSADDAGSGEGHSAVTVSGEFGQEPEVTWDGDFDPGKLETETLITGEGPAVEDGQQVFTRLWLGNGFTEEKAYSTFGDDATPELLTVGSDMTSAISAGLEGQTIGSRVVVASSPKDAFGEQGNPQLGIGNADPVLFVMDLVSVLPDGPSGADQDPAGWAPAVEGDDKPTSLDFKGTPKPSDKLRITTLIEGEGEPTENGQQIYVNYLGQVYDGDKPFDSSYERGEPLDFELGAGGVVKGWDQGLKGVPVGSRVILAVPPDLGYGDKGNKEAGILGTDTLYFVVDVLAAI
jgi:peptidylprolyl isomerase